MADRRGLNGRSLARETNYNGAPVFIYKATVTTSDSTVDLIGDTANFSFRVIYAWGVMTAGGGASDTAVLQRIQDGTTAAITDTADLSVFSDTDQFDFSQLDDANWDIQEGDTLQVTTASSPACEIFALCVRI